MREAHIRVQSNGFLVCLDRFRVTTELSQRVADLVLRFRIIRTITQRGSEVADRVLVMFLLVLNPAELVVCRGVIGLDAYRSGEGCVSVGVLLEFLVGIAELKLCGCIVWLR